MYKYRKEFGYEEVKQLPQGLQGMTAFLFAVGVLKHKEEDGQKISDGAGVSKDMRPACADNLQLDSAGKDSFSPVR